MFYWKFHENLTIWLRYCQFTSYFFCFCLNHFGIPRVRFPKSFIKIRLDLAERLLIWKSMIFFVCLFVLLLFSFESSWDTYKKFFWTFHKNWTWFIWDIVDLKIVYLFDYLLFITWVTSGYPQNAFLKVFFCKDWTWFSWNIAPVSFLFVCLFHFLFRSSQDTPRKTFWNYHKDWAWFSWNIVDLKMVYLFVCLFVWLFFVSCPLNHLRIAPKQFTESFVKIGLDVAEILLI